MDSKPEKPLRLFVNPFAIWTDLALKTGQAIWASAHAAVARSNMAPKVAVIPNAEAARHPKVAVLPAANAPRKARALARHASKAVRKTTGGKLRSKASRKRRAR
jgi:hypothetical protein